jgi:CRP-like cAMP-binding protein
MADLRELKDKATQLTVKGKLPAALEAWQAVVAADPNEGASHQKVAELFAKLGKKADAVRVYEESAARFAKKGLFFKASAVSRLIVSLEPGHTRTQEMIATLFAKEQRPSTPLGVTGSVPSPSIPAPSPVHPERSRGEGEEPALPSIPLFSTLSRDELKEILSSGMEVRAVAPGEVVVAEGSPGDSMFALVEGTASVFRGWGTPAQRKVAQVATGDIFGEAAMVSGGPRLATVLLEGGGVALEFRRDAMGQIVSRHAHVGQMIDQFYRERLLANVLRASPILRALPEADKLAISASFQPCTFVDGQRIINEGQPADSVHLLLRGVCAVSHASGERYPDLREGDLFGELSVLTDGPATASVAALGPVLTLRLPASAFKARVLATPAAALVVKATAKSRLDRTARIDQETQVEVELEFDEDSRV